MQSSKLHYSFKVRKPIVYCSWSGASLEHTIAYHRNSM